MINDIIKKKLTVICKSEYGKNKIYYLYKNTGELPLEWAVKNIKNYKIPEFSPKVINSIESDIQLRELQKKCMEKVDEQFSKNYGGGIINLSTGAGKTVLSLYIISKYRLKTLIIVNTVELMNQWISSIKKFLKNIKVGIIKQNKFEKDCDICVGMIQTISMRKEYDKDCFKDFGITFIDECHHLSSEIFSETLFKCRTKYVFGLSATVERKDGLEYVFKYHLGDIIFSDKDDSKKQDTDIKILYFSDSNLKEKRLWNGNPSISNMLTEISLNENRNKFILDILSSLEDSRKILVLSDRIIQLEYLHKNLGKDISGMFIGKTDEKIKEISKTKKIILATYNIASEGFDLPLLNTLLFATPRSNIIQAIGRIYRKKHDIIPMIIDIVDKFSIFPYQFKKREKIYSTCIKKEDQCLFE